MKNDLLFEIGTEELPSICINEGMQALGGLLKKRFEENNIGFGKIKTYGTPRRLAAIVKDLRQDQDSVEKIVTGPPYRISFDDEGNPTKAALGFAKSNGIKVKELEKIDTGKGEYLGLTLHIKGKKTTKLLPSILEETIRSISFSMQMTWSDYSFRFARPIRWLLALYGAQEIGLKVEDIVSVEHSVGHRTLGSDRIIIKIPSEYPEVMEKQGKVIVSPPKRKDLILKDIKALEHQKDDFKVLVDPGLLGEVINLVEIPNVLVGSFPKEYLEIPREILIKAIQHHQRYFAVLDKRGKVKNKFVFVQNGKSDPDGEIVKGNQRVLKARLSDASYFYNEDNKRGFDAWFDKLSGVVFYNGLGNMQDKSRRLEDIGLYLIDMIDSKGLDLQESIKELYKRSSYICKCDLVTNMVVEFPELQGIVGKEYAKGKDEKKDVAESVFEQYLPRSANDILPSTHAGAILSIADKIDTITGMFIVDNIPTGSQDPFALRRKATGIVLTSVEKEYDFNLEDLVSSAFESFLRQSIKINKDKKILVSEVVSFILARHRFILEKETNRIDIFDAVSSAGCSSVFKIKKRFDALKRFIDSQDVELLCLPMTRCKNIVKNKEVSGLDEGLLFEKEEKELFAVLKQKKEAISRLEEDYDYYEILQELKSLGPIVDRFFDAVLVMDKDEKIKQNRIDLVNAALAPYLMFADFSKIIV